MSPEQKTASDEYLAAVAALTEARQQESRARSAECAARNATTEAERLVKKTQEVFARVFGIAKL